MAVVILFDGVPLFYLHNGERMVHVTGLISPEFPINRVASSGRRLIWCRV